MREKIATGSVFNVFKVMVIQNLLKTSQDMDFFVLRFPYLN